MPFRRHVIVVARQRQVVLLVQTFFSVGGAALMVGCIASKETETGATTNQSIDECTQAAHPLTLTTITNAAE